MAVLPVERSAAAAVAGAAIFLAGDDSKSAAELFRIHLKDVVSDGGTAVQAMEQLLRASMMLVISLAGEDAEQVLGVYATGLAMLGDEDD